MAVGPHRGLTFAPGLARGGWINDGTTFSNLLARPERGFIESSECGVAAVAVAVDIAAAVVAKIQSKQVSDGGTAR